MWSLIPVENDLVQSNERLRLSIFQWKQKAQRTLMESLRGEVSPRYERYFAVRTELERLGSDEPLDSQKSEEIDREFARLYKKHHGELRDMISARQDADFKRQICPYCGLVGSRTLDHQVPKARFPEFYVLLINLVPSCRECNTARDWLTENGDRRVINFYFDPIPVNAEEECLEAKLVPTASDRCKVVYEVREECIDEPRFVAHYRRHFRALGLKDKYEMQANAALDDEVKVIEREPKDESEMRRSYGDRADVKRENKGINHWESVFFAALNASDVFWSWIAPRRVRP